MAKISILIPTIDNDGLIVKKCKKLRSLNSIHSVEICISLNSGLPKTVHEVELYRHADKVVKNINRIPVLENFRQCLEMSSFPLCLVVPVDDEIDINALDLALSSFEDIQGCFEIAMLSHAVRYGGRVNVINYGDRIGHGFSEKVLGWLRDPFDFIIYLPMRRQVLADLISYASGLKWRFCDIAYRHRRIAFPLTIYALMRYNVIIFDSVSPFCTMNLSHGGRRASKNFFNSLSVDFQCSLSVIEIVVFRVYGLAASRLLGGKPQADFDTILLLVLPFALIKYIVNRFRAGLCV